MRIVTWNVNSLNARLSRVERWLQVFEPDVLCLQETKLANDAFPALAFEALGYESLHHGEGRWNGVAILSRVGLEDPIGGFGDGDEPDDRPEVANEVPIHLIYFAYLLLELKKVIHLFRQIRIIYIIFF